MRAILPGQGYLYGVNAAIASGDMVVDPSTWSGPPIFFMGDSAGAVFCTEEAKVSVEDSGFMNVSFLEDGIMPI